MIIPPSNWWCWFRKHSAFLRWLWISLFQFNSRERFISQFYTGPQLHSISRDFSSSPYISPAMTAHSADQAREVLKHGISQLMLKCLFLPVVRFQENCLKFYSPQEGPHCQSGIPKHLGLSLHLKKPRKGLFPHKVLHFCSDYSDSSDSCQCVTLVSDGG